MTEPELSYAVVTPAWNENENLRSLARSLAAQTAQPGCWIIVDNGSSDATPAVARELARRHPWVQTCAVPDRAGPTRAESIVRAVQVGLEAVTGDPDVVVKLDADISFEPDYFARLLGAFAVEPSLGIASGTCYEPANGAWRQRHVTGEHVWGAARAYRRACLREILPLEPRLGWDGIDEVKAAARGWRTKTLLDLPFYHHRREGEREGRSREAWAKAGRAAHYLHYRFGYLVLRALHHARRDPAALALLWGFASAASRREPRCDDAFVRAYVRRRQTLRELPLRMREALGKRAASA